MKILLNFVSFLCLSLSNLAAAAPCPSGGSEHSVGDPTGTNLPLARFQGSAAVEGARDLIRRNGFCPISFGPQVEQVELSCDDNGVCRSRYTIEMPYENPDTLEKRTVWGALSVSTRDSGPLSDGFFEVLDLGIDRIGQELILDDEESELFMTAMVNAGIEPDQVVVGSLNLVAGRLECSRAMSPNAATICDFTVVDQTLDINDQANAADIHDNLARYGGVVDDGVIGAVITRATLVTCTRNSSLNAVASCTLIIEN